MNANVISSEEPELVLHRLVTEQIPVVVFFMSEDKSVTATVRGFVNSFTRDKGLAICTPFLREKAVPATLEFPQDLIGAPTFRYADETEMPEGLEVGSGLRIEMPTGNSLTTMEIRAIAN